jgi:hypothetical protein
MNGVRFRSARLSSSRRRAGWAGDSWIKWVTSITVLDREHDGFWMARAYRHPGRPVQPGTTVAPELMQPVTSLRVKSVIADPIEGATPVVGRPLTIRGAAWGGDAGPIAGVDVSVDSGRTWTAATMRRNQRTEFGWRLWEYRWTPTRAAYHTVWRGRAMPPATQPLKSGVEPVSYGWNVVPRVGVNVVDTGGQAHEFRHHAHNRPPSRSERVPRLP